MNKYDAAANLAMFLQNKTGSICGEWGGKMKATEQRALFGKFIGKGWIKIDGAKEEITHTIKVCFGLDWDVNFSAKWIDL